MCSSKYILIGSNKSSESITLPKEWTSYKINKRFLKDCSYKAKKSIKSTKFCGFYERYIIPYIFNIKFIAPLDAFGYNKESALRTLISNWGYKDYPYKHYENTLTRFYQGYILPTKFGIDKRRVHYSSLIVAGQLDKKEALEMLKAPTYESKSLLGHDMEYFCWRMDWSMSELNDYLGRKQRTHSSYPPDSNFYNIAKKIYSKIRK